MNRALWWFACVGVLMLLPPSLMAAEPVIPELKSIVFEPITAEREYAARPAGVADTIGLSAVLPHLPAVIPTATKLVYATEQEDGKVTLFVGVDQGLATAIQMNWKFDCNFLNTQFNVTGAPELVNATEGTAIKALTNVVLAYAKTRPIHQQKLKDNEQFTLLRTAIWAQGAATKTHLEVVLATEQKTASVPRPEVNYIAKLPAK